MPPHPLTNFEIQEYHKNEPRFNGVYSRDNLPKTIKWSICNQFTRYFGPLYPLG